MKHLLILLCLCAITQICASENDCIAWNKVDLVSNAPQISKPLKVMAEQDGKLNFTRLDIIYGDQVYVLDKKALAFFQGYPLSSIKLICANGNNIHIGVWFERIFYENEKLQRFERLAGFDVSGKYGFMLQERHNGNFTDNAMEIKVRPIKLKDHQIQGNSK